MKTRTLQNIDYYLGGTLVFLLKPVVLLVGKMLRRDHSLEVRHSVCFLKLLGGGSLVGAFPALLGFRRKYPNIRMLLITTKGVEPFAESLAVFDEIVAIDTSSIAAMIRTGLVALKKCLLIDTVFDLEVYSRLTAIFAALSLARNRIGFYLQSVFWRRNIYTHLVFFNRYAGAYHFYEKMVRVVGAMPSSYEDCKEQLCTSLNVTVGANHPSSDRRVGLGHACSDLSFERMMSPGQWEQFFRRKLSTSEKAEVHLLGGQDDRHLAQKIVERLEAAFPQVAFRNHCGKTSLADSLRILASMDVFWGIDSSLLHYARLFGLRCHSVWGPTAPRTLLKPFPGLPEEVSYAEVPCSPCVHITEIPPCNGNNICIRTLFEPTTEPDIPEVTLLPVHTDMKRWPPNRDIESPSRPLRHPQPLAESQRDGKP